MADNNDLGKNQDLTRRIFFTLAMLAVYRIGVHVPTPGVDSNAVMAFFQAQSAGKNAITALLSTPGVGT